MGADSINWLIVDNEDYFENHQEEYNVKKGSKGIEKHIGEIQKNELLLIYCTLSRSVEQIYRVTERCYPTNNVNFPKAIGVEFVEKLDVSLSFKQMKTLTPNLEYVRDYRQRAIGEIKPNEWKILKDFITKNNPHLSEIL